MISMRAVLLGLPLVKMKQLLQKAPWVHLWSMLLLILFLGVLFVNLTVHDESGVKEVAIQFSVRNDENLNGSLFDIASMVQSKPAQSILRTHLNETPYWVHARLEPGLLHTNNQLVFRSRHLVQSSCWRERSNGELIELVLQTNQGRMLSADMQGKADSMGVLCNFKFRSECLS